MDENTQETPAVAPWNQGAPVETTPAASDPETGAPVEQTQEQEQLSTTSGSVTNPGTPETVSQTADAVQAQIDGTNPTPNVTPGEVAAPGFSPNPVTDSNVALQPPAVVPQPNTDELGPTIAPVATVVAPVTPAGTSVVPPTTVDATTVPPTPVSPIQGVEPVSPKAPIILGTTVIDNPVGTEAHIFQNNAVASDEGQSAVHEAAQTAAQQAQDAQAQQQSDAKPASHETILTELLGELEGINNMAKAEIHAVIARARALVEKL